MKISKGGQISIPATIRKRWNTRNVRIVDEGDRLIVRPQPDDPVAAVRGIWADEITVSSEEARRIAREDERRAEERKYREYYGRSLPQGRATSSRRPTKR